MKLEKIFGVSVVTVLLCLTGCTNKNATSEHEAVTILAPYLVMLGLFLSLYQTYIQKLIYEERLKQMDEVTHQMFLNLEDVMDTKWEHVQVQCNLIEATDIQTVDENGKYYTEDGNQGLLRDAYHFENSPEKISYVSNFMTTNDSRMVFLKKLDHPIRLQSGQIINYYGLYQDMQELNEYFGCDAYEKNNSVYILDQMMFRPQTEEKHQMMVMNHDNIKHEWVNGDQVHLMQIFSNLLSNAAKYTQEGGKIQFFVEEYEIKSRAYAKYRFVVSDNGMGMSADFKDTIFDTITRAESSLTNKIQETGFGMAITRNMVEAMGGSSDVENERKKSDCRHSACRNFSSHPGRV